MKLKLVWVSTIAAFGLTVLGCASNKPAEPFANESVEEISATVTAIDVSKRLVTLKGEKGHTETIEVSPQVRNLAQVKVGDQLVVRYYSAVAASLVPKGAGPVPNTTNQAVAAARAEPGARPGAAVGSVTAKTVTIQDVDKSRNEVTFTGDDGIFRSVQIKNPDAQKFASTLKKGDQVDVTFSEAVAVSVEPAK